MAKAKRYGISAQRKKANKKPITMSLKEFREQQRIAEAAHIAPGQYDGHLKEFGYSPNKKMTLGGKYKWKADENPAAGQYHTDAADALTKPKSRAVIFKEESGY